MRFVDGVTFNCCGNIHMTEQAYWNYNWTDKTNPEPLLELTQNFIRSPNRGYRKKRFETNFEDAFTKTESLESRITKILKKSVRYQCWAQSSRQTLQVLYIKLSERPQIDFQKPERPVVLVANVKRIYFLAGACGQYLSGDLVQDGWQYIVCLNHARIMNFNVQI